MKFCAKIFICFFLMAIAVLNATRAEPESESMPESQAAPEPQSAPDASVPKDISLPSEFNLAQIDTTPLPEIKRQANVARLPANALMDAFGLPMFVPIDKTKGGFGDVAGGEIGRIVNRISINGVLPNQEVIIETYIVPLGGSFAVKISDKEIMLLHVKEITDDHIDFGWSKDNATYRYALPEKGDLDIDIENQTPEKIKDEYAE